MQRGGATTQGLLGDLVSTGGQRRFFPFSTASGHGKVISKSRLIPRDSTDSHINAVTSDYAHKVISENLFFF